MMNKDFEKEFNPTITKTIIKNDILFEGSTVKEALFYESLADRDVRCKLCPRMCLLANGETGDCQGRKNVNGRMIAINYGEATGIALDPVEKKPLYHFFPNENVLSLGPNSCNLHCQFCQNFTISQQTVPTISVTPEKLVELCFQYEAIGIAFTYSEPLMWYEFILDTAAMFHEKGLKVVMVSNGYINPKPFQELLPLVDAWNIDLKAYDDDFYRKICDGQLAPVLRNIKTVAMQSTAILELTNLVIPQHNDAPSQIQALIDFVADLNPNIPLHFSRYHPTYRMKVEATPEIALFRAAKLAKEKLHYVYIGNMATREGANTYCPKCGNLLIERTYFQTVKRGLVSNSCASCGTKIYGCW